MSLPDITSPSEWRAARLELLAEEKAMTQARDALNTKRRRLPMVRIDKEYRFTGPEGSAGLLDLFAGRRQLIVVHFMFDPSWDEGCPSARLAPMRCVTGSYGTCTPEIPPWCTWPARR